MHCFEHTTEVIVSTTCLSSTRVREAPPPMSASVPVLPPPPPLLLLASLIPVAAQNFFWYNTIMQETLLEGEAMKKVDVTFVDFNENLKIPENPLVFKARELQVVCEKYKKFLEHKPQLFNMTSYTAALNLYIATIRELKGEKPNASDNSSGMAGDGNETTEGALGDGVAASVDSGVSPDNPLTR